mgnify:FL=1
MMLKGFPKIQNKITSKTNSKNEPKKGSKDE